MDQLTVSKKRVLYAVQVMLALSLHSIQGVPLPSQDAPSAIQTPGRGQTMQGRPCTDSTPQSPLLASLRMTLMTENLYAYIFFDNDPHSDENVNDLDRTASFIAGYDSLHGNVAIVTLTTQVIFVRDRTPADAVLDCTWQIEDRRETNFMKWGANNCPTGVRVGADSRIVGPFLWKSLDSHLNSSGTTLVDIPNVLQRDSNNVTLNNDSAGGIFVHELKYTGKSWTDKMSELLLGMTLDESDALVSTSVDDIAWLFNLRGSYYQHSPLFPAFSVIIPEFADIGRRLQISLYLKETRLSPEVRKHLKLDDCEVCVAIKDYDEIYDDLSGLDEDVTMRRVVIDRTARQAILSRVDPRKARLVHTPVSLMKAVKNKMEIVNMKAACLRDAVYVAKTISEIEKKIVNDEFVDELQATALLSTYRGNDELNRGDAFPTVSAFGANAAIPHYFATNASNTQITAENVYLLDTGGQYLDGTVDGTRTFHFGRPTNEHKEIYTRVLMGVIDVFNLIWVAHQGRPGDLTLLARRPLWALGLDYSHGSGHGVGQFMNVHEDPINFMHDNPGRRDGLESYAYRPGVVQAIEPGAYLRNHFGVRLETMGVVVLQEQDRDTNLATTRFPTLRFDPLYFLPFETKLIKFELLTNRQIYWLNSYHSKCRNILGQELKSRGYTEAYDWLKVRTEYIEYNSGISSYMRGSGGSRMSDRWIMSNFVVVIFVLLCNLRE